MAHWKLTLSYHGAHFHGWQVQPGLATVQGLLADALHVITGEHVLPQGAGRTDAGVHALAQVASFTLEGTIPPANLQRALNRQLPPGIRVLQAQHVPANFHARHSARGKQYEYRIFERRPVLSGATPAVERLCSPFLAPFVWDCRWPLSFDLLQAAASRFLGTHDFSAFAAKARITRTETLEEIPKRGNVQPNPVKTIAGSAWHREEGLLIYRVSGNGFLHHMVRNLVGTMVDIGRGSLELEDLPAIFTSRDRSQAGPTAPAGGLYLVEVRYPSPASETCSPAPITADVPGEAGGLHPGDR